MLSKLGLTRIASIGRPENRVRLGEFEVTFADGVLIIEGTGLAHVTTRVEPRTARILIRQSRLVIDLWDDLASCMSLNGSSDELAAAWSYFQQRGFAMHQANNGA